MTPKASQTVTRAKCATCGKPFKASRRDARYCSGRCRQRALRARAAQDDLLRQVEEAKRAYWMAVRRYAEALGVPDSEVLTDEAQFVDEAGNVWIRDELAGHKHVTGDRAMWGLEAAGPPWSPPTDWEHDTFAGSRPAGTPPPAAARPLPDGSPAGPMNEREFTTIIADPPWQYDNTASRGAAQNHYTTLTAGQLCSEAMRPKAADRAHLYLWATAAHLPEAFRIMAAWGFTHETHLVWVKPQMGMGNYFRHSTELVLFGVRGGLPARDSGLPDFFKSPRTRHSAKPGMFFGDFVSKVSPGPYLEMFARYQPPAT